MTSVELISLIVRTDLGLGGGILAVLVLRLPARRWLGARAAYRLWLLPLAATLAVLLPARIVTLAVPATAAPVPATSVVAVAPMPGQFNPLTVSPAPAPRRLDPMVALSLLWMAGVVGAVGWFGRGQLRLLRAARQGLAGPAAVGVIRPRVVVPADFERRYSRAERTAILAHEAAHIALQHPRANGLAAAVQALHWFNPLVHLAAHLMRIDQELACDAAVVGDRPRLRRLYAETLLKSQLSTTPLPLGCYWPPRSDHPLTRRVEMLNRPAVGRRVRIAGAVGVAALTLAAGVAAWAAQPARVRTEASAPAMAQLASAPPTSRAGPAQPIAAPKAFTLTPDTTSLVRVSGVVVSIEWTNPRAIMHLIDKTSGQAWAVETGTPNTLLRAGMKRQAQGVSVEVFGFAESARRCEPECKLLMRQLTFADGTKLFLGPSGLPSSDTQEESEAKLHLSDVNRADKAREISRRMVENIFQGKADYERQPPIPPGAFERDLNAPIHMRAQILAFDEINPRARAHLADLATGKAWAVEVGSANTIRRGGIDRMVGQTVDVDAFQSKDHACQPECKAVMRSMTFPDGRKIFLGASGVEQPDVLGRDKAVALQDGDWRGAAMLGASAADIVRAMQARGKLKDIVPDQAVVTINADGGVEATPMKPLLPLSEEKAAARTASLAGTGFAFAAKPGTIILYPDGNKAFGASPSNLPMTGPTPRSFGTDLPPPGRELPSGWRPFAAYYDGNAPVLLKGQVVKVDWARPRVMVHMVDDATGKAWSVEGGAPEVLADNGFTKERFAPGTRIVVRGYQAKDKSCDPECRANGRNVSFPDGKTLYVDPSNLTAQSKKAMVEAAQADLNLAQHTYEDADARYKFGLISALDLERYKRDVAGAQANLAVMQAR